MQRLLKNPFHSTTDVLSHIIGSLRTRNLRFPLKSMSHLSLIEVSNTLENGEVCAGLGTDFCSELAYQKALYEYFERRAVMTAEPLKKIYSSNGVAAHRWSLLARKSALDELIERDAFLMHWYTKTPFLNVPTITLDKRFSGGCEELKRRFQVDIKVKKAFMGLGPAIFTFLITPTGGFVLGLSYGRGEQGDIEKSFIEACVNLFFGHSNIPVHQQLHNLSLQGIRNLGSHRAFWLHANQLPAWVQMAPENTFLLSSPNLDNVQFTNLSKYGIPIWQAKHPGLLDLTIGYPSFTDYSVIKGRIKNSEFKSKDAIRIFKNAHPIP